MNCLLIDLLFKKTRRHSYINTDVLCCTAICLLLPVLISAAPYWTTMFNMIIVTSRRRCRRRSYGSEGAADHQVNHATVSSVGCRRRRDVSTSPGRLQRRHWASDRRSTGGRRRPRQRLVVENGCSVSGLEPAVVERLGVHVCTKHGAGQQQQLSDRTDHSVSARQSSHSSVVVLDWRQSSTVEYATRLS